MRFLIAPTMNVANTNQLVTILMGKARNMLALRAKCGEAIMQPEYVLKIDAATRIRRIGAYVVFTNVASQWADANMVKRLTAVGLGMLRSPIRILIISSALQSIAPTLNAAMPILHAHHRASNRVRAMLASR